MGNSLLITGGTGFFGLALLRNLTRQKKRFFESVTILSRDPSRLQKKHPDLTSHCRWVEGDLLKPETLPYDDHFTHILHAGAESSSLRAQPTKHRYSSIVKGTSHMLQLARSTCVEKFMFVSSGAVYGAQPASLGAIDETRGTASQMEIAADPYVAGKIESERLTREFGLQNRVQIAIARCFSFTGIDLPLQSRFAVSNFVQSALFGDVIEVNGDGNALRSYMDQSDLARWLLALLSANTEHEIYNVGGHLPITVLELASLVRDLLAPEKPIAVRGGLRSSEKKYYVPNNERIKKELRIEQVVTLPEAINKMALAHMKQNGDAK